MEEVARSPLIAWESFYVIVGSSGAALRGRPDRAERGRPRRDAPTILLTSTHTANSVATRERRAGRPHLLKTSSLQSFGWLILEQCLHSLQSGGLVAIKCSREPAR